MASSKLLFTGLNSGEADYGTIVGAEGVHFLTDDGRRLIDASNTAGPLGHGHPDIVAAVRAAATAPVINEGWRWPEREQAARDLIEIAFAGEEWAGAVRFCLSGSEANDLALSLCQALTGRTTLATRERAYHGMTGIAREMTVQPHWHGGLSSAHGGIRPAPRSQRVIQLPGPGGSRIANGTEPAASQDVRIDPGMLDDCAAVIIDYSQGGAYHSATYQDQVASAARAAGALWVADEVVTGLGRTMGWFAFQGGASRPDIVTMGKPLAGGGAPAGAVMVSSDLLAELNGHSWQTYSTFRGHPMLVAALRAHLRILVRDGLIDRVCDLDATMEQRMRQLAQQHRSVVRIDGRGLHWTVELVGPDWREWQGDVADPPIATLVAARAAEAGALIGTSGEQTSLFLAPPLIITDEELETLFDALDHGLAVADEACVVAT